MTTVCSLLCSPFAYSNHLPSWIYIIKINFGICECPYIINGITNLTQRSKNHPIEFLCFFWEMHEPYERTRMLDAAQRSDWRNCFKNTISTIILKTSHCRFRKRACLIKILHFIRTLHRFLQKFLCTEFITWSDQHLSRILPKDETAKHTTMFSETQS